MIVLTTAAVPALAASSNAAPAGTASATTPASATSASSAAPSLGIGPAISTSRRPPSTLGRLGVDAASDSASQVQAVTSAPALLPTGVNAGHGARGGVPAVSEFGGAAALVLLAGGLLGYRRRAGAHGV